MGRTSYSQTLSITNVQRDSIYAKIERGKINAERVHLLQLSLQKCDSVKKIKTKIIELDQIKFQSLFTIIENKELETKHLNDIIDDEVKRGRRRGFWGFVKGVGAGAFLVLTLNMAL